MTVMYRIHHPESGEVMIFSQKFLTALRKDNDAWRKSLENAETVEVSAAPARAETIDKVHG